MRYITKALTLAVSLLLASATWAEEGDDAAKPSDRPDGGPELRERILDEFDADGDGQMSEGERATARKEMQGRRGRRGSGARRHGPPNPAEVFERFDENGDDQLSREEFMKLADEMRKMRERHGRGEKFRGRRPGPPDGRPGPPDAPRERRFDRPDPLQNPGDDPRPRFGKEGRSRDKGDRPGARGRGGRGRKGRGGDGFRPPNPEEVFNRFDTNGDEQLSRQEFIELTEAMRALHDRGRRDRPDRGRGGNRRKPPRDRDAPRPPRPRFDQGSDVGPMLPGADDISV